MNTQNNLKNLKKTILSARRMADLKMRLNLNWVKSTEWWTNTAVVDAVKRAAKAARVQNSAHSGIAAMHSNQQLLIAARTGNWFDLPGWLQNKCL